MQVACSALLALLALLSPDLSNPLLVFTLLALNESFAVGLRLRALTLGTAARLQTLTPAGSLARRGSLVPRRLHQTRSRQSALQWAL